MEVKKKKKRKPLQPSDWIAIASILITVLMWLFDHVLNK